MMVDEMYDIACILADKNKLNRFCFLHLDEVYYIERVDGKWLLPLKLNDLTDDILESGDVEDECFEKRCYYKGDCVKCKS